MAIFTISYPSATPGEKSRLTPSGFVRFWLLPIVSSVPLAVTFFTTFVAGQESTQVSVRADGS